LGLVTAAATAGWLWHVQGARVQALEYKTAAAHHGDLTQTVTANGQINPVMNVFPRHLRS
jgi:multidrug efflux pump subunit AcrA (membrane-fusion protein)